MANEVNHYYLTLIN